RDIAVGPNPHVVSARRTATGPSGVGPDRRETERRLRWRFGIRPDRVSLLAGILQNSLDVVRSALGVDEHLARMLPLDPVERGETLVVLRGAHVGYELPASGRHEEVKVPDLCREAIVREVGDRVELAEIVRASGRLHDEGKPDPVEDLSSFDRVTPG